MRLSKQDWLVEGLKVLVESGVIGLTIDALVQRLGVTKGSFYHHFPHVDAFKEALLDYYEQHGTHKIMQRAEQAPNPHAKLEKLMALTLEDWAGLEVALRAWALTDARVHALQTRIDAQRIAYVEGLCYQISGDDGQAWVMARLLYTILVGGQQIFPPLHGEDLDKLYNEYRRLYGLKSEA